MAGSDYFYAVLAACPVLRTVKFELLRLSLLTEHFFFSYAGHLYLPISKLGLKPVKYTSTFLYLIITYSCPVDETSFVL